MNKYGMARKGCMLKVQEDDAHKKRLQEENANNKLSSTILIINPLIINSFSKVLQNWALFHQGPHMISSLFIYLTWE